MNLHLALVLTLVVGTLQAEGVIVAGQFNNFTCLKTTGKNLVIIRALQSTGTVDTSALNNIKLANQAGFLTDVYMFVCPGKNASTQVNEMIDYLGGNQVKERLLFSISEEDAT